MNRFLRVYLFPQASGQLFSSGGGMAQSRHQPGVSPINPSVRAQVPHQFLSPQVLDNTVYNVNITSVVCTTVMLTDKLLCGHFDEVLKTFFLS